MTTLNNIQGEVEINGEQFPYNKHWENEDCVYYYQIIDNRIERVESLPKIISTKINWQEEGF